MKLRIGNFEIKIKARDLSAPHLETSKDDTALFLMQIMNKLHDASHRERKKGMKFTAEESRRWAFDISEALQNRGYLKRVDDDE